MSKIRLDFDRLIPKVLQVTVKGSENDPCAISPNLKKRYPRVFGEVPGEIVGYEANIQLVDGAVPVFLGPGVISIPLRGPTDKAIRGLENQDRLVKFQPGPWGTPIV